MMEVEAPMRRSSSASSSPEFEFWMDDSCLSPPELLTADELFVDGIVLPLQLLALPRSDSAAQPITPEPPRSLPPASIVSSVSSPATPSSGSRRWRDLFKVLTDKKPEEEDKDVDKKINKERKSGGGSAELNINLWPFSRSRSEGNTTGTGGSRTRSVISMGGRKVSSAPCSRSNSSGESSKPPTAAIRRWASSPGRGGVYLGRNRPLRKLRRAGVGRKEMSRKSDDGLRVLNLDVNSCIGYGNQVSCRGDYTEGDIAAAAAGGSGGHGRLFSLRDLFSKKVN